MNIKSKNILAEAIKDATEMRKNHLNDYYKMHQICPRCKTNSFVVFNNMNHVLIRSNEPFKDYRTITCECGWCGIFDNLIKGL